LKARLLADADLHPGIVNGLRKQNPSISFHSAQGFIPEGMPDRQVLALAAEQGRVLVSHDFKTMPRHFHAFIREGSSPGLILIPQGLPIGAAIEELQLVWECYEGSDFQNRLLYLPL
jgi:hypothetical protein